MTIQAYMQAVHKSMIDEQEKWLEFWMSKYLNPIVIRWIKERKNLSAIAKHIEKMGFRILVTPDGTKLLMLKDVKLSEFKVTFRSYPL